MRRTTLALALLGAGALTRPAWAAIDDTPAGGANAPGVEAQSGAGAPAQKPTAGPDDAAIAPVFGRSGTWTGQVAAGALGPGSKATTSQGRATCGEILDGLWYTCDVQDTYGTGPEAQTFRGHMIVGYDRAARAYKATMVDNQGSSLANMDGRLEGKKFVLETPTEMTSMGQRFKDRLTFDFTDPKAIRLTDEHQVAGQDWQPFEQGVIHPEGQRRQARIPPGP